MWEPPYSIAFSSHHYIIYIKVFLFVIDSNLDWKRISETIPILRVDNSLQFHRVHLEMDAIDFVLSKISKCNDSISFYFRPWMSIVTSLWRHRNVDFAHRVLSHIWKNVLFSNFLNETVKYKGPTGERLWCRMKSFHMAANDFRNELRLVPFLFQTQNQLLLMT